MRSTEGTLVSFSKRQVVEATTNAETSKTDTRNPVAYVPKLTRNLNNAVQQENRSMPV